MSRSVGTGASFGVKNWPHYIYPGSPTKGRRLVRLYKRELIDAGAVSRIGRELVVFVEPFNRWMQKRGRMVADYECPANRARDEQVAQ
jgi:hypothetical protein